MAATAPDGGGGVLSPVKCSSPIFRDVAGLWDTSHKPNRRTSLTRPRTRVPAGSSADRKDPARPPGGPQGQGQRSAMRHHFSAEGIFLRPVLWPGQEGVLSPLPAQGPRTQPRWRDLVPWDGHAPPAVPTVSMYWNSQRAGLVFLCHGKVWMTQNCTGGGGPQANCPQHSSRGICLTEVPSRANLLARRQHAASGLRLSFEGRRPPGALQRPPEAGGTQGRPGRPEARRLQQRGLEASGGTGAPS